MTLPNGANMDIRKAIEIVRKKQLPVIIETIEKHIREKSKGNSILGIFGSKQYGAGRITGDQLMDFISIEMAKKGYTAMNWHNIIYEENGEIIKEKTLPAQVLAVTSSILDYRRINKLLAEIANNAIFIMNKDRSGSVHEEMAFIDNEKNKDGIGIEFYICEKNKECIYLKQETVKSDMSISYQYCDASTKDDCQKTRGNCPFHDQCGMDFTTLETFVSSPKIWPTVVKKYENIPLVAEDIYTRFKHTPPV